MRLIAAAALLLFVSTAVMAAPLGVYDFGLPGSLVQDRATAVEPDTNYMAERGYGWVGGHTLEGRDRGLVDKLQRDFVFGTDAVAFRVDLPDGYYRVTVVTGDTDAGNHVVTVEAEGEEIVRDLQPAAGEIVEYAFTAKVADGSLDLRFSSSARNWVLNGLVIESSEVAAEPTMRKISVAKRRPPSAGPVAHSDRLNVIKKPDYEAKSYPDSADFMRILERFPMYSERGWHANYLDNAALGYFGDADHGEMGLRAMGNYIFVTALLATDPAYDPKPSGVSRETLLARARACLAYMTRSHATGDIECADGFQWGNAWQSAWWAAKMAAGARILWPRLTAQERNNVERVIIHEADRHLNRVPPSGMTSDTKSEENGWDSEVLAWALGLFPRHPNAPAWRVKLIEFCMNTLSAPQDRDDSTLIDGKPVKDWIVSTNIHEDYTIENHGAYHFCYMACPLHSLAWGFEGVAGGGQDVPEAMFHHFQDVWRWAKRTYVGEGRFAYLSGKDWPRYAYGLSFILPATVLAQLEFDDPHARRIESDRIATLEREQLINADGSFYGGRFTRNVLDGRMAEYETDTYANIALCYLLHRRGKTLIPTDTEKMRKHLAGSWSSPGSGWAFGRSDKLFASFSWRYLHGIRPVGLFIPAGCADMAEWMPNQLVGQFDVVGVDPRKAKLQHAETTSKTGFSTTGEITHCDSKGAPLVRQQISFTALTEEGIAVVMERTVAVADVKVKSSRALNFALANDIFNGSVRKISCDMSDRTLDLAGATNLDSATAAEPTANAVASAVREIRSPVLNIDDRLGIALLKGDNFTIHDTTGRNAQWGSIQYDVISALNAGEREVKTGETIIDSAFALVAKDHGLTVECQMSSTVKSLPDEPAVVYASVNVTPVRFYMVVSNLDGTPRTVSVPFGSGQTQEVTFKGFETQVFHLNTGGCLSDATISPVLP